MIWLVLIISLILRLISINQSLWLDEAINVNNVASLDLKSLIGSYALSDFHPPLYHIILKGWALIFGVSEITARLPSVLFGIGTVFTTYLIGLKLFEKKTALIAATLISTAPLAIYYSQEARMYSLAAFLASLTVYFFISLIKKESLPLWLGFIISASLTLYTDYLPYLLFPAFIIYIYFIRKKIQRAVIIGFIPAILLIFISLVPWFTLFPKQVNIGLSAAAASPAWAHVVGAPELKNLIITPVKFTIGRISTNNDFIYAIVFAPIAAFLVFLFSLATFRISHTRSILWYWLFVPIILGFPLSFFIPVFAYFRFLFVLPAFYLIIASGINTVNWIKSTRILLIIILLINLVSASIYFINPKFQREDWRNATNYVITNSSSKTITLFESNFTVAPFDYYNRNRVEAYGALESFIAEPSFVKQNLLRLTKDKNQVFLFQYLSTITDPQGLVSRELFNLGFTNTSIEDFYGVGFIYEFMK